MTLQTTADDAIPTANPVKGWVFPPHLPLEFSRHPARVSAFIASAVSRAEAAVARPFAGAHIYAGDRQ